MCLGLKIMARSARVCQAWNKIAMDGSLWTDIKASRFERKPTEKQLKALIKRAGAFLRNFSLSGSPVVTSSVIHDIAMNCKLLTSLDLHNCRSIPYGSWMMTLISNSSRLERLNVSGLAALDDSSALAMILGTSFLTIEDLVKQSVEATEGPIAVRGYMLTLSADGLLELSTQPESDGTNGKLPAIHLSLAIANTSAFHRLEMIAKRRCNNTANSPIHVIQGFGCYRTLTHLNLSHCRNIGSEALQLLLLFCFSPSLGSCTTLTHLYLSHLSESVDDSHLRIIGGIGLPNQTRAGIKQLKHLVISHCRKITDRGIRALCGLSGAYIVGYPIDDEDLWEGMPEEDEETAINDDDAPLRNLYAKRKGLSRLNLQGCDLITDASLTFLSIAFPSLKCLELGGCRQISNMGLKRVVEQCCNIELLDLEDCISIGDDALEAISYHLKHSLTRLSLSYCDQVSEQAVARLIRCCVRLKHLEVDNCSQITDSFLHFLRQVNPKNLRTLELYDCRNISFAAIRALQKSTEEAFERATAEAVERRRALEATNAIPMSVTSSSAHLAAAIESTTGISVNMLLSSQSPRVLPSRSMNVSQASISSSTSNVPSRSRCHSSRSAGSNPQISSTSSHSDLTRVQEASEGLVRTSAKLNASLSGKRHAKAHSTEIFEVPPPLQIRSFYTSRVNENQNVPNEQLHHLARGRSCVIL
ncbi:hypothetical protein HDU67_009041 [Dinochytrium kinnereticum]|nr:hypothetical protein HDU67_009041 [Dinochytrium kinnereticum]